MVHHRIGLVYGYICNCVCRCVACMFAYVGGLVLLLRPCTAQSTTKLPPYHCRISMYLHVCVYRESVDLRIILGTSSTVHAYTRLSAWTPPKLASPFCRCGPRVVRLAGAEVGVSLQHQHRRLEHRRRVEHGIGMRCITRRGSARSVFVRRGLFAEIYTSVDIHVSRCLLCIYVSISIHLCIHLPIHLSIYLSIYPSIHPPIHPSIYPSIFYVSIDPDALGGSSVRRAVVRGGTADERARV
jgi:hypothetical protein